MAKKLSAATQKRIRELHHLGRAPEAIRAELRLSSAQQVVNVIQRRGQYAERRA